MKKTFSTDCIRRINMSLVMAFIAVSPSTANVIRFQPSLQLALLFALDERKMSTRSGHPPSGHSHGLGSDRG